MNRRGRFAALASPEHTRPALLRSVQELWQTSDLFQAVIIGGCVWCLLVGLLVL